MPRYRSPRPLLGTKPERLRTSKPDMRNYSDFRNPGDRPSARFDWAASLYLHACSMRDLGYKLSHEQRQRIEKGDPRA